MVLGAFRGRVRIVRGRGRLAAVVALGACAARAKPPELNPDGVAGFSYVRGDALDFVHSRRVCLRGQDLDVRRDLTQEIVGAVQSGCLPFRNRCDGDGDMIEVEYQSLYSTCTHCPAPYRGPKFGFAQLTSVRGGRTRGVAAWSDTRGGEPVTVARRFGEALCGFLKSAGFRDTVE